jgi:aminotransferase
MEITKNKAAIPAGISRRVSSISNSATKQMAVLAAGIGGCVSLGQGVPSFATPPHIIEAVTRAIMKNPLIGKYSLQTGMPELRNRIARYLKEEKDITRDPETEICVTVGAMEALLATVMTVVDIGDEVILPSPAYASYIEQILLANGIPKFVPLSGTWELDMGAMEKAISPKTRAVMLCNPGNPTGNVFSDLEIITLCEMAVKYNFVIITDETYDYMIYDGKMPISPASIKKYKNHVISIFSLSKKYALTGWRIGWVTATQKWMDQIMKVHDATTICAPTPSQFAALAAMEGDQTCVDIMKRKLIARRELCCRRLDNLKEFFSYVPPSGAFYIMAKYLFSKESSEKIAIRLLDEARVITIPGGSFGQGGEGHLRISFGGDEKELTEAFDRIDKWVNKF